MFLEVVGPVLPNDLFVHVSSLCGQLHDSFIKNRVCLSLSTHLLDNLFTENPVNLPKIVCSQLNFAKHASSRWRMGR